MKQFRIIIGAALLLVIGSTAASAQSGQLKLDLNYNYSLPLGSFKSDLINQGSGRGFSGSLQYGINNKWAAGLGVGFQDYYQKYPRAVYQLDKTQSVSAVLTNSIQVTPIMAKGTFMPMGGKGAVQPYISVGAGASLVDFKQYLGEFTSNSKTSASFVAQGGVGVNIPFGRLSASGIKIGADYNYVPYKNFGYNNLSSVNFHAGVFFPLR
ncbi:outer membrane beta-barrel protein [Ilyomonas limi]|nr:outer membrane beta-barrel protein [Ilyomonas limi]